MLREWAGIFLGNTLKCRPRRKVIPTNFVVRGWHIFEQCKILPKIPTIIHQFNFKFLSKPHFFNSSAFLPTDK